MATACYILLGCRHNVRIPDSFWYYQPFFCSTRHCRMHLGYLNRFVFIGYYCSGCPICESQTSQYMPKMMEPGPVTLMVKIYDHTHNIRYPSLQRVRELQVEFATQCKGKMKPGSKRRYFICIHCGRDNFSNKLMLNQHRYEVGCSEARYSDRSPALLLPYPDFKSGQGKLVEVMGKGVSTSSKGTKAAVIDEEGRHSDVDDSDADEDGSDGDFVDKQGPMTAKRNVTGNDGGVSTKLVQPTADLFFAPAPPKQGKEGSKSRASQKGGAREQNPPEPKGSFKNSGEENLLRHAEKDGASRDGSVPTQGRNVGRRSHEGKVENAGPAEEPSRPLRRVRNTRKPPLPPNRNTLREMGFDAVQEGLERVCDPPVSIIVVGRPPAGNGVMAAHGRAVLQMTRTRSTTAGHQDCVTEAVVPTAPPSEALTILGGPQQLQQRENLKRKAANKFHGGPLPKSQKVLPLQKKKKKTKLPRGNNGDSVTGSILATRLLPIQNNPAVCLEDLLFIQSVPNADDNEDASMMLEKDSIHDKPSFSPNTTAASQAMLQPNIPQATLEEATSQVIVWPEKFNDNKKLLLYWADGKGSPKPFTYHPGVEEKFLARKEILDRQERLFCTFAKQKADENLKMLNPPTCPTRPPMPGLYHLQQWGEAVSVPWEWRCASGEDFRAKWETSRRTAEFEERLVRLLHWWTVKKYDGTVPDAIRAAVSASIDSVVASHAQKLEYPELRDLCKYIQFTINLATFEADSVRYKARVNAADDKLLDAARKEFRTKNARMREEILWDWCPFWRIISANEDLLRCLPSLPWTHNVLEAIEARRVLTRARYQGLRPIPLVYVLKMMFWNFYGVFRQLCCPMYGLTEEIVVTSCQEDVKIKQAVAIFCAQGPYLFTGLPNEPSVTLQHRLAWEIAQIREGKGANIVAGIMEWVRKVQLRALQDHAAGEPEEFQRAWCTEFYQHWGEQSKVWSAVLRTREDRDIGWICTLQTPSWSPEVHALLVRLRTSVCDIARVSADEDNAHWSACVVAETSQEPLLIAEHREQETSTSKDAGVLEDTNGIQVFLSKARPRSPSTSPNTTPTASPSTSLAEDVNRALHWASLPDKMVTKNVEKNKSGSDLSILAENPAATPEEQGQWGMITRCGLTTAHAEGLPKPPNLEYNNPTLVEDPYSLSPNDNGKPFQLSLAKTGILQAEQNLMLQKIQAATKESGSFDGSVTAQPKPFTIHDLYSDEEKEAPLIQNAPVSIDGTSPQALFQDLQAALEDRKMYPADVPLMSLTQVQSGSRVVEDMPIESEDFDIGNLTQWTRSEVEYGSRTPENRVTLVSGGDTAEVVCRDSPEPRQNLTEKFQLEKEKDAADQLVDLARAKEQTVRSRRSDRTPVAWPLPVTAGTGASLDLTSSESVAVFQVDSELATMTLPQVYSAMQIEKLVKKVPGRGEGEVRKKRVAFFNHCRKEVEVKHSNLRDLKKVKTRLGNDIMDFVLSRLYMQHSDRSRDEVHVISSRACSALNAVMCNGGKGIDKFASDYLHPPPPTKPHQVKKMLLPWIHANHWSLLVFQPNCVFHLDSAVGKYHLPKEGDSEIVRWMSLAWQHLRGVSEYPVLSFDQVDVFQQVGNNECGHHVVRNVMLYLKAGNLACRERQVIGDYIRHFRPKDINVLILTLVSQELDEDRRDNRFLAPFCPMKRIEESDSEKTLLMDGKPYSPISKTQLKLQKTQKVVEDLEN